MGCPEKSIFGNLWPTACGNAQEARRREKSMRFFIETAFIRGPLCECG